MFADVGYYKTMLDSIFAAEGGINLTPDGGGGGQPDATQPPGGGGQPGATQPPGGGDPPAVGEL